MSIYNSSDDFSDARIYFNDNLMTRFEEEVFKEILIANGNVFVNSSEQNTNAILQEIEWFV